MGYKKPQTPSKVIWQSILNFIKKLTLNLLLIGNKKGLRGEIITFI